VTDEPQRRDARQTDEANDLRQRITEVGVGITLVGVIFNMGLTIGLGLSAPLYVRLPLAFGVPLGLVAVLAYLSRRFDLLSTIPWWLTRQGPDPWERFTSDDEKSTAD
jgi:hypothetical protein